MPPKTGQKVVSAKPILADKPRLAKLSAIVNFISWALLLVVYCTTFLEDLKSPPEAAQGRFNVSQGEGLGSTNYAIETYKRHNTLSGQLLIYFGAVTLVGIAAATLLIAGLQQESYWQCKLWLIASAAIFLSDLVMTQVATALRGPNAFLILKQFCNLANLASILLVYSYMKVKHYKWPHPIPEVVIVDCEDGCTTTDCTAAAAGVNGEDFYGAAVDPPDVASFPKQV